jgi:hypothetical protein
MTRKPARGTAFPLLLTLLSWTAACSPGEDGGGRPGGGDLTLDWAPIERYAVGGFDAPEWATFGEVGDVGFDADGNLYILDDQVFEVTVVSPGGEFLRRFGGAGEGPGEIGQPMAMTVFPDGRVAISDLGKRAIALFDASGEWVRNVSVDLTSEGLPGRDMTAHPDGWVVSAQALRFFMSEGGEDGSPASRSPETRPVYLYPVSEGGEALELYGAWDPPDPPEEDGTTVEAGGEGNRISLSMSALQAFEPGLHVTVLGDGRVAVVDSTTYRIRLFDPSGDPAGEWSRPIQPEVVTDRIRDMERDRQLSELAGESGGEVTVLGGGPGISFDATRLRAAMRERVEGMSFYPEIPVIAGIGADGAGRVWVERAGRLPGEEGPVDLLSPEGEYLGSLPAGGIGIPAAFGPGGLIAVLETDEFDVATIRVLEVPAEG